MTSQVFIALFAILYLAIILYLSNRLDRGLINLKRKSALAYPYVIEDVPLPMHITSDDADQGLRSLFLILMLLAIGNIVLNAFGVLYEQMTLQLNLIRAISIILISVFAGGISALTLLSDKFRRGIAHQIGTKGTFNADSYVHRTALVLAFLLLAYTSMDIIAAGGVTGLAENLQEQEIGLFDAVANLLIMPVIAVFGVGWVVRRNLREVIERLGLRFPHREDILWGIGIAFACLIFVVLASLLMTLLLPAEALQEQGAASEEIARAFGGSLLLVFVAAFSAAVGEEILFRGALQPVFGLIPTTLFFALLHSQYTLTPAAGIILIVGGAMGWLKQRKNTTAAIIAHFVYNFVQLGIAYLFIRAEEAGLLPDMLESMILLPLNLFGY